MAEKRAEYLQCSLCGFEFEKLDSVCASGCPLGAHCGNVRCPNCNFEFPAPSRAARWMRGWFRRRPVVPTGVASVGLDRIPAGSLCLLDHLGCASGGRRNTLTVFGLTPGTEFTLLQRHPSYVIRVGETELGLDEEIAREIFVRSA